MKKFFTIMVAAFAAVSAFAQSRTILWEGEQVMDGSWPSVGVELSNLATAKAGDNIVVTTSKVDASINSSWEWGSQVFLKVNSGADGDWEDMAGTSAKESRNLVRRSLRLPIRFWSSLRTPQVSSFKACALLFLR